MIRQETLLAVSPRMHGGLLEIVRERMRALDVDEDAYLALLRGARANEGELEHLIGRLTISETHFFRGDSFPAIRSRILPEVVEHARRSNRHELRFASIGCATGEEAYSLSILAQEEMALLDGLRLGIVGIDINTDNLVAARRGVYRPWALRGLPESYLDRYFETTKSDERRLVDAPRRLVRFQYANIATDPLPAPALGMVGLDLILCQNVLYYFQSHARAATVDRLVRCLADGGWLVLGPADQLDVDVPECRAHDIGDIRVYQRLETRSLVPSRRVSDIFELSGDGESSVEVPAPPALPRDVGVVESDPAPRTDPTGVELAVDQAVALANAGAVRRAIELFDGVLHKMPDDARVQMLRGLLLIEIGALEHAKEGLRRAVYLDSDLLLAHAGMVIVARGIGDAELERRHANRIASLGASRSPADAIEGWDGMTVGRLMQLFARKAE